jgi:hypothetical protein
LFLVGRLHRTKVDGQHNSVRIIIPTAVHKERRTSEGKALDDETSWDRLQCKRVIAEAAVDGLFPEDVTKKLEEYKDSVLLRDLEKWVARLDSRERQGTAKGGEGEVDGASTLRRT